MAEQTAHEYTLPIVSNMAGKGVVTSTDVDYDPNNLDTSNLKEKSVGAALKQAEDDISNIKTALENTSTLKSVTYNELVALRNENKLIPGSKYRIIDYVTTTTQANTSSAGHQFDVIVEATSENTLSEDAKVIKWINDTSGYFDNSDLNAWNIKYCLDNDTNRFAWVDPDNGKGVIYYMKDEHNNECWYDFKNIQFKCVVTQTHNGVQTELKPDGYDYAYTFTDSAGNDLSLTSNARNNCIKRYNDSTSAIQYLNHTLFICSSVHNNTIKENSYCNVFYVNTCYYNNIGIAFQNNFINTYSEGGLKSIHNNIIGNLFKNNRILSSFSRNTIGNTTNNCDFFNAFAFNKLGDNSWHIDFNYPVSYCEFGSYIQYCIFNNTDAYPPVVNEMKWCYIEDGLEGAQYFPCCQMVTVQSRSLFNSADNFHINDVELIDGRTLAEALTQEHTEHLYVYRVGDKCGVKKMSSPYIDLGSFDSEDDGCSKAASPEIVGNPNINNIIFSVNGTDNKVVTIEQYSDGYAGAGQYWTTQYLNTNGKKYSRKIVYNITDGVVSVTNTQSWVKIIDTDIVADGNSRVSSRLYSNGKEVAASIKLNGNTFNSTNGLVDLGNIKTDLTIKKVSYLDLAYLKKNNKLTPGQKYRIVDYKTTTSTANTSATGHQFDVIVEALTTNTLSEDAKVCLTETPNIVSTAGYKTWSSIASSALTSISQSTTGVDKLPQEIFDLVHNNTASVLVKAAKYSNQTFDTGLYRATITYNSGNHGVNTLGVAVKNSNGDIIAIGAHRGRGGSSHRSNQYYFSIPSSGSYIFYAYYDNTIETIDANTKIVIDKVSVDDYFHNSDLESWKIKYCLDNDTSKFAWAYSDDSAGNGIGYGVIYYMKDEFGNEAPYDFKNILFTVTENEYYTFHSESLGGDMSLYGNMCSNNSIKELFNENDVRQLPGNTLLSANDNDVFMNNIFNSGVRNCSLRTMTVGSLIKLIVVNYEFLNGLVDRVYSINSALNSSAPYWDKKYVSTMSNTTPGGAARYGVTSLLNSLISIKSSLSNKQANLVSGTNIKTINGESLLGSGDIAINGSVGLSGILNVTNLEDIIAAQSKLEKDYDTAFYVIADDQGNIPSSTKNAVSVSAECMKQLSCSSPNSSVQTILADNIPTNKFKATGMSVGDIIVITRLKVLVDVLLSALGLEDSVKTIITAGLTAIGLSEIEIYQHKLWHTNDVKWQNYTNPDGSVIAEGVKGLMSVYDKTLLDNTAKTTKWGWHADDDFTHYTSSGVNPYTRGTIDEITANWSLFVDCSADPDGSGYYHFTQTAICRDYPNEGRMWKRMGWKQGNDGAASFTEWKEISKGVDRVVKKSYQSSSDGWNHIVLSGHKYEKIEANYHDLYGFQLLLTPSSLHNYVKNGEYTECNLLVKPKRTSRNPSLHLGTIDFAIDTNAIVDYVDNLWDDWVNNGDETSGMDPTERQTYSNNYRSSDIDCILGTGLKECLQTLHIGSDFTGEVGIFDQGRFQYSLIYGSSHPSKNWNNVGFMVNLKSYGENLVLGSTNPSNDPDILIAGDLKACFNYNLGGLIGVHYIDIKPIQIHS